MTSHIHVAHLADIDPVTLYRLLKLRTDVFVVEQECAYPELDGRDLEPDALMLWTELTRETQSTGETGQDGEVVATLRILRDDTELRIGRVVTAPEARGTGVARELFQRAVDECGRIAADLPIVLDAQEPLEGWYGSFGFVRESDMFLEDGIPHVTMRKAPGHGNRSQLSVTDA